MGTDFTNDDVVKESSNQRDYTHELIKDTTISGRVCWKVELIPTEDAPVVWGKVHAYIAKEEYIQVLTRMYDEDGYLVNTMIASEIKKMGGKMLATKFEMIPADKEGHKTIMEYKNFVFNQPIDDKFFSVQSMKRLK